VEMLYHSINNGGCGFLLLWFLFVRKYFWNKTGSSCCNIIHETGSCHFDMTHLFRPVLTYINNQKHKVTILVIFIHQSFLQYISFHSMWAIQTETERNSGLGSSWSSFCGTLSLISQLIYDDIAKMFHLTAENG
jgi:hypothetical protein